MRKSSFLSHPASVTRGLRKLNYKITSLLLNSTTEFNKQLQQHNSCVEFSFNNTKYRQTDGIAMGSPLGPVLANIFVGYTENKLFDFLVRTQFYQQYVDDTFAIFENEAECNEFFNILNSLINVSFSLFPCTFNLAKLFQKAKPVRLTQALRTAKSLAGDLACFHGAKAHN